MESSKMFTETIITSENFTSPYSDDGPEYFKYAWIISQIFTVFMLLACMWSITAFYKYGCRQGRWDRSNNEKFTLMLLATLIPCLTMLRLISSQVIIVIGLVGEVGESANFACEFAIDLSCILYGLASLPTYFYLWKRQQILYSEPFLSHLNTNLVKVFSYAAALFLLVADIGTAIFYVWPNKYEMSDFGCRICEFSVKTLNRLQSHLIGGGLVLSQMWIFALLVYPLRRKSKASIVGTGIYGTRINLQKKLKKANKLAVVSMAVCIFSDICAMVLVTAVIPASTPRCLIVTVYDISLMINIFSLMLSHEVFKFTVPVSARGSAVWTTTSISLNYH